ncbi:NAD-dependent epimerase/dehydratase family protein [Pseudomonas putida]|uniref:UDP-glucose 4-epimerase family protein n=1 Tax=Pseudomonas putida TaxID=303 RepID=UPI0013790BA8|nr:SDR family oxidoreductase [Pseudomonas putida]NBA80841.1 NAD-dependent epimerase/dehydratase family protein [Pseudomonas putida]
MKVLVTGAGGFVGKALCKRLEAADDIEVIGAVRTLPAQPYGACSLVAVGDIDGHTDWSQALAGVSVVVHLAARAHVLNEQSRDPREAFRRVNVEGALALFQQAIDCGLKRFVFISSIGVVGGSTEGKPFTETMPPAPHADYAHSKYEAEEALKALSKSSGVELVIVRPPLVYAAHAPGNFARLLKLVALGVPLPFGGVMNQRSMVALENLVDFITLCVRHPAAAGETFHVSDDEDVSLPQMLKLLGRGMGRNVLLLPVPTGLMALGAQLLGKKNLYTQLCGSLRVDSTKSRSLLGWQPPISAEIALLQAGASFNRSQKHDA